jgi:hypothetical protein
MAAAWLLAAWKYGTDIQRSTLLSSLPSDLDASSPVRAQALPLLVAAGESITEWVAAKPGLTWESALDAEYLRGLVEGEDRALGIALNLLHAELRLTPQRYLVLPRALPLAEVARTASPKKLTGAVPGIVTYLAKNPDRLRDHRTEHLLSACLP